MNVFFRAVCCAVIVSCLVAVAGFYRSCEGIEDNVLRLHIIGNSDSDSDQAQKLHVRDELLRYTDGLFTDCSTKQECIEKANAHLQEIKDCAKKAADSAGGGYDVDAYVTNMRFDTRVYDDFTLPAGRYDALRIVIGEGRGHNWWCVLYPAVCVPSACAGIDSALDEQQSEIVNEPESYAVRLKVVELFEGMIGFFGI